MSDKKFNKEKTPVEKSVEKLISSATGEAQAKVNDKVKQVLQTKKVYNAAKQELADAVAELELTKVELSSLLEEL